MILINHGKQPFTIEPHDRIAQMVIARYEQAEWDEIKSLDEFEQTERGVHGFGHTGIK